MGMPRYVREKWLVYTDVLNNDQIPTNIAEELISLAWNAGFHLQKNVRSASDSINCRKIYNDALRHEFRIMYMGDNAREKDPLEDKIQVRYFKGMVKEEYGEWEPEYGIYNVSRSFAEKVRKIRNEREIKEREIVRDRDELERMKWREYSSRTFPTTLRTLIFKRDGFTCKMCGKHKDVLVEGGDHLEVDHITAYKDGGKTCLENGQTLCSACNKGKHHAQKYLLIERRLGFSLERK